MSKKKIEMNEALFTANNVFLEESSLDGDKVLRVTKDPKIVEDDEDTLAKFDTEFTDGTLEVKVLSRLLPDAPEHARGFIGLAFRIDEKNHFEGIYVRPTNSRVNNQLRRNRSTQYFSYPDYKYDRFRAENPGEYESYADIGLDEWIDMKIVVSGETAQLFLNDSVQPVLVVNDLKHGANQKGSIGLWVDVGTEGFFKDLSILE